MGAGRTFDGNDDIVTGGTSDTFMQENVAGSVVAWIKPTTSDVGTIIRRTAGAGNVAFLFTATSALRFFVGGATSMDVKTSNSTISNGSWQAIAYTWDGSTTASNVHIYINLTEPSYQLQTNCNLPNDNSAANVTIGNNTGLTGDLNAVLAHLQVFNRQLSLDEVKQATYRPGSIADGLVRYWPLFGDDPEQEISGNNDDGTVSGSVSSSDGPPVFLTGAGQ